MPLQVVNECCPICGSSEVMHKTDLKKTYRYCQQEYVVGNNECFECENCTVQWFGDGMVERNNQRFADLEQGTIPDGVSPRQIHGLRERYWLSAEVAATCFGCSEGLFFAWEQGEAAPEGASRILLRIAINHEAAMELIAINAGYKLADLVQN